jgi:integrase
LWQENGLVFASEMGTPLDRRDVTSCQFKLLLKRAKLRRIPASMTTGTRELLTKNVNPKVVSEMLGHSNIAITLDTYSHLLRFARTAVRERYPWL